jgi:hypothetical protein
MYRLLVSTAFVVVGGDSYLVTQDFLLLVQESEEIRHKRVMTASQASA